MFVFSTYLIVFLLKFRSGELVGCGIWFCIQRVPTLHTFDGPRYPKNKKYLKKRDDDKFRSRELVGWGIWFCIQQVPTLHTFDWPHYPKNKKYLKKCNDDVIITFFQVFLVFGVAGSIKSIQCGYSLDSESNSTSNELSRSKFE